MKRHGTQTGYQYGCRCSACREAQRVYMADLRARHAEGAAVNPRGRHVLPGSAERRRKAEDVTPDWMDEAECRGATHVMFPNGGQGRGHSADYGPALAICARCPVLDECWAWVVETIPAYEIRTSGGVWAGRRPNEAVQEIRAMKRRATRSVA